MKIICLFEIISILLFNFNNGSWQEIHNIVINQKEKISEKEKVFRYFVNPVVYKDNLLIDSYYVTGVNRYHSPLLDKPIEIQHDKKEQLIRIKCLKPFDKQIFVKIFSLQKNYVSSIIVLDYKEKINIEKVSLSYDSYENYFYIDTQISKSIGTKKTNTDVVYHYIKYDSFFIDDVKKQMQEKAEEKIKMTNNFEDITFNHSFFGFENDNCSILFNRSKERVFSFLTDKVSYSYYNEAEEEYQEESITYNVYDLLTYSFFFKYDELFEISYSIDTNNYLGSFGL